MARTKADYALLWANGATFAEIYDMIEADVRAAQTKAVFNIFPREDDPVPSVTDAEIVAAHRRRNPTITIHTEGGRL